MAQHKTERGKVPISAFQKAATDIRENKFSIRRGAEKHGIGGMTLKRSPMGYSSHRKVFTVQWKPIWPNIS